MAEGYKAGSIYVDFEVVNANASKELDRLEKKLKTLANQEKDLKIKKEALFKTYKETIKLYGEESKEAESLKKKIHNLSLKEVELKNNIAGVQNSIKEQTRAIVENSNNVDEMAENIKKSNKNLKDTKTDADAAAGSFNKLSGAITAVKAVLLGAAAQKLYEGLIVPNAELESNLASFEILLGSYEKANQLVSELTSLAAKTPLTSTDLTSGAKQLLAVGVQMGDITDVLRRLGDLSLGSADKLQRLINAYGKINTSGKATLEYLNLFTENGIPIIEELANVLGVSTEEFYKLSKAGKVTSADVNKAIKSMTSEGGKFYQMLDKQSKTFQGVTSTIKDNLTLIGRDIGAEAFEQLKDYLDDILKTMEDLEKTGELDKIVEGWGGAIAGAVKTIGDLIKTLYEFRDVIGTIITAMAGAKVVFSISEGMKALGLASSTASAPILAVGAALAVMAVNMAKAKAEVELTVKEFKEVSEENKKMFESYNEGFKSLEEQKEIFNSLSDSLETLTSQEDKTVNDKENIKKIVDELNKSYEGLNLKYDDESDKLNRNIGDIKEYAKAMQDLQGVQLNIKLGSSAEAQIEENNLAMQKIRKQMEGIQKDWESYDWAEQINKAGELEALKNQFNEIKSETKSLEKVREDYLKQADELQKKFDEESKKAKELAESMKTAEEKIAEAIEEGNAAMSTQEEIFGKLEEEVEQTCDDLNDLTSILEKSGRQITLNKSETQKLIKQYPELLGKIKETSDGYQIERGVIEELIEAKKTEQLEAINSEIEKTRQVITSTADRVGAYSEEVGAIKDLASARAFLDKNEPVVNIGWASEQQKQDVENVKKLVSLMERLNEVEEKARNSASKIGIASSTSGIKTSSTKTGSTKQESSDELELRNLKYNLNMGYIEQAEYYDKLEALRDKYYANGTKEWQSYTLEITKGRKTLADNLAKAEEKAYEERLSGSYAWLEDEQFYGRLDSSELIAGYERMKKYTKEYYENGKISYERYAEEIKKLDKEIYKTRKETLETTNKDMEESIKKRYDSAIKELNDYYDEIDRLEEEREREEELGELEAQAKLYEKAVTKTGKEKYNEILDNIKELKKEGERVSRDLDKQEKIKEIEGIYEELQTSQQDYLGSIIDYSEDATSKIEEMTRRINEAFNTINSIILGAKTATGGSTTTYNQNLYQTNNISDRAAGQTVIDLSEIAYGFKNWG